MEFQNRGEKNQVTYKGLEQHRPSQEQPRKLEDSREMPSKSWLKTISKQKQGQIKDHSQT